MLLCSWLVNNIMSQDCDWRCSVLWRAAAGEHPHTRDTEPDELPLQHPRLVPSTQCLSS
jgi:hypothetical protein